MSFDLQRPASSGYMTDFGSVIQATLNPMQHLGEGIALPSTE